MAELRLVTPLPPSINHYLKMKIVKQGKRFVPRAYEGLEARTFKAELKEYISHEVDKQGWTMNDDKTQHYYCDCIFYFPRIDMDVNNYFKVLLDGITESKVVWPDDNLVCERANRILYDKDDPRVEVVIREVEYVGIFNSQSELESFEDKCKSCTRYIRNCSLLRKAKEGRIQDEIVDLQCSKYKKKKE